MDSSQADGSNRVLSALLFQGLVRLEIGAIVAGCVLGVSSHAALTTPTEVPPAKGEGETCPDKLNALVSYLDETARIDGTSLRIERQGEGTVVLHHNDFIQHMTCRDGEVHVDARDPH